MRGAPALALIFVLASCGAAPVASTGGAEVSATSTAAATASLSPAPAAAVASQSPAVTTLAPSPSAEGPVPAMLIADMTQAVSVQASARRVDTWSGLQGTIRFDQVIEGIYQRPDRRRAITTDRVAGTVFTVIEIGPTRYVQMKAGAPWQVTQPNPPYKGEMSVIASFDLPPLRSGTVARAECSTGTCFVLSGGYDLGPGARHSVTLTIDERSRLPVQMTTKNTYGDGTSYTVIAIFGEWGTPVNIQAPKV